eukprot:jgi/Ulvmu1/6004/UM026_0130.1
MADGVDGAVEADEAGELDLPGPLDAGLLTFQQDCIEELLKNDGLSVLGQGLGLCTITAALLAVHHQTTDSGGAVVMVGSTPTQRQNIAAELKRLYPEAPPVSDVTAQQNAPERMELYSAATSLFVTTRILTVDLLTERLRTSGDDQQIAGLIILNAHRATDDSGEGFAVRLLRSKNRSAFVRGLTDDAAVLSLGLSTLERSMRALLVSRVSFWPRFQEQVQQDVIHVDVHDMSCDLSPSMTAIQQGLLKVLDSMLKQVQRSQKLDSSELNVSNALTRSFDAAIRRQLDPVWNTVTHATQSLVRDIRTVQDLLTYLLRFNCVSFLRYLQCLRAAAGPRTEWMLHSAANTVFLEAKARVYKVTRSAASARGSKSGGSKSEPALEAVLEEQPKWLLLREIAEEIQAQRGSIVSLQSNSTTSSGGASASEQATLQGQPDPPSKRHKANGSRAPAPATAAPPPAGSAGNASDDDDSDVEIIADPTSTRKRSTASHGPASTSAAAAEACDGAGGAALKEEEEEEAADAWIPRLSQEQLRECGSAPVLVVAKEAHLLSELRSVLTAAGGRAYLKQLYREYLQERTAGQRPSKVATASDPAVAAAVSRQGTAAAAGRGGRRGGGRGGGRNMTRNEQAKYKLQMLSSTAEEEVALRNSLTRDTATPDSPPPAAPASGRGRGRGRGKRAAHQLQPEAAAAAAAPAEAGPLLTGFHFVTANEAGEQVLHSVRPVFVVLYDAELAWVRMLEVYQALNPSRPLKVYMITYHESVEVARFQMAASREKHAFMSLIRKKAHMVVPVDESGKLTIVPKAPNELARGLVATGAAARTGNALTRRAGGHELVAGRATAAAATAGGGPPTRVIVDIREFMSPLPAVLHARGMDVVPVTLEVGDFVLSPDICVERKAVPDLIASLDSGRLYTQAVAMCRAYATPVLLIEFDPGRAFAMQSAGDLGLDIRAGNVASKLIVLLLNFPKIRLVWSRSLHATADMFLSLKRAHPEPDAAAAAEVGLDQSAHAGGGVGNPLARDMLLELPGVAPSNVFQLMDAAGSLAGLGRMTLVALQEAIGSKNGKALHDFLHASFPAA